MAQGLMDRQKLRSVQAQANGYMMAIEQFRMKYGSLPGDMPNATEVWGRATDSGATPGTGQCTNTSTDKQNAFPYRTCNGNGNGLINGRAGGESALCESYRAWQQLSGAKMIDGIFSGTSPGSNNCSVLNSVSGNNTPVSKMDTATFTLTSYPFGDAIFFDPEPYNNIMFFGGMRTNNISNGPFLTTSEAREIDEKNDDAKPATGSIRSQKKDSDPIPDCADSAAVTAVYNERLSGRLCSIIYMSDYAKTAP